ncbi:MAG: SRPBCC domain-containing protein [Anaerolineae bacterium]|nr:SRPBCC domain-containing protein [Anaerolineae bacterium]
MSVKQPTSPKDFLRVSRVFAAPRSKVFRAWTEPDILRRWWGPKGATTPVIEMDLQVGGRYRFGMKYPDRDIFYVKGVYREVQVPEKLVFTWRWESPDMDFGDSLVTIEFHEQNGGTEVTLRHEGFPNEEVCRNHEIGWQTFFDNFAVVEDM